MKEFWSRFSRNRGAVIGVVILAVVIACAIAAPILFPQSPWSMVQRPFLPPFEMEGLPLGTDAVGRDVVVGLVHGARVSLLVGWSPPPSRWSSASPSVRLPAITAGWWMTR